MDLLTDYDCQIIYHRRRGNVVVDALNRRELVVLAQTIAFSRKMMDTIQLLRLSYYGKRIYLAWIWALPDLFIKIWETQATDPVLIKNLGKFTSNESPDFRISDGRLFRFQNWIWVSVVVRTNVLKIAHASKLSIHPRSTKMYRDLKRQYWWIGIKKDIVDYISRCLTYQWIKGEH